MDSPPSITKRPLENDDIDDGDPVTKIERGLNTINPSLIQSPQPSTSKAPAAEAEVAGAAAEVAGAAAAAEVVTQNSTDQNEEKLSEYCIQQKQQFHHLFEEIVSGVSASNFSSLSTYLLANGNNENEESVNIQMDEIVKEFRKRLLQKLTSKINSVWQTQEVDHNLMMLEDLTKFNSKHKTAKWRPSGTSSREQTRAYRIELLKSKNKFLRQKIEPQSDQMSNMLIEVEKNRKTVEDMETQRLELRNHMSSHVENLKKVSKDISNLALSDSKLTNEFK